MSLFDPLLFVFKKITNRTYKEIDWKEFLKKVTKYNDADCGLCTLEVVHWWAGG